MGCGGPQKVIEENKSKINPLGSGKISINIIKKDASNEDLMTILYLKITKLITNNPFYDFTLIEFDTTLNDLNDKRNNENSFDNENVIDEIISKYLWNIQNYIKILFKNFVEYAVSKFNEILPDNEDLIILILYFLYFFLSGIQPGKKNLFKEKIKILLNKAKNDSNEENKFKISLLHNLLINFIQMFTFCFGSFFLLFGFLDKFENYNKDSFEKIIKNNNIIKEVQSLLNNNFKNFNENMSPYYLNLLIISEINNKINYLFDKVDENEEFIILEDNEIDIILESLIDTININNFVDYFFFGENREY